MLHQVWSAQLATFAAPIRGWEAILIMAARFIEAQGWQAPS